jgi:hypothetical protein
MDWNKILNWKLLPGSHDFPGPDGGTCINEAAAIAAGFKYRAITKVSDCPSCFSHMIASYALLLNDKMPDDLRQELLMPFVTRLAGTAASKEIEQQRAELIFIRTVRDILPILFQYYGDEGYIIKLCREARTLEGARYAARCSRARVVDLVTDEIAHAASCDFSSHAHLIANSCAFTAVLVAATARAAKKDLTAAAVKAAKKEIFSIAVSILDEAIRLGNPTADAIDVETVKERMEAAKHSLAVAAS